MAQANVNYFSDIFLQQLYQQSIYQATQRQRTVNAGLSGNFPLVSTGLYYQRSEVFSDRDSSVVYGSTPRATVSLAPRALFGSPVYAVDERRLQLPAAAHDQGRRRLLGYQPRPLRCTAVDPRAVVAADVPLRQHHRGLPHDLLLAQPRRAAPAHRRRAAAPLPAGAHRRHRPGLHQDLGYAGSHDDPAHEARHRADRSRSNTSPALPTRPRYPRSPTRPTSLSARRRGSPTA